MRLQHRLFVYGSLLSGLKHHDQMKGARLLGARELLNHHLVLYEDAYPALVPGRAEGASTGRLHASLVVGELYEVSEEHLKSLDQFEECPKLYQRRTITLSDGSRAESYLIEPERAVPYEVISGNYRCFDRSTLSLRERV